MPPPDLGDREGRGPGDGRDEPDVPRDSGAARSGRGGESQARQGNRARDREEDPPSTDGEAFGRPGEREGRRDRESNGNRGGLRAASEGGRADLRATPA